MKFEDLPEDIKAAIEHIDIKGNKECLPNPGTPRNKYEETFEKLFPGKIVHNSTSFDYGRSYAYFIYNSGNEILARTSQRSVDIVTNIEGDLDTMLVQVSAVSRYLYFQFSTRKRIGRDRVYFSPETPWHKSAEALVLEEFGKLGFKKIPPEWAHLSLPDIETELCDMGEASVVDCLF